MADFGFFNSYGLDRKYSAEDFNRLFDGLLTPGILPTVGDKFAVMAGESGMTVNVKTGTAWFNRSWLWHTSPTTLTLSPAHPTYGRYDVILLQFDKRNSFRRNVISGVIGTPSPTPTIPTIISIDELLNVPIAHIFIPAGSTAIDQENITSLIGLEDCPFATGMLQQFSIADLVANYTASFYELYSSLEGLLEGDAATYLQNQINNLTPPENRNILINGNMQIMQKTGAPIEISGHGYWFTMPDRWRTNMFTCGGFQPSIEVLSHNNESRRWLKLTTITAKPTLDHNSICVIEQRIEGNRLHDALFGRSTAKPLTLSFKFRSNVVGTYVCSLYCTTAVTMISKSFEYDVVDSIVDVELTFTPNTTNEFIYDNSNAMAMQIWLAAGSDFSGGASLQEVWGVTTYQNQRAVGQVNMMETVGNWVSFTDVQLEVGALATPYERRSNDVELAECQRYMERVSNVNAQFIITDGSSSTGYLIVPRFRAKKRYPLVGIEDMSIFWVGVNPGGTPPTGDLTLYGYSSDEYGFKDVIVYDPVNTFAVDNSVSLAMISYIVSCEL